MTNVTFSLTLGSFILTQTSGATRVLADGTSKGNPVALNIAVQSWLQDGAIVAQQGYDNREMSVRVRFYGDNLAALNALEASLFAELGKPNALTITPSVGFASVFDVVTSSLDIDETDDFGEGLDDPWRTYVLRITALPFARSATQFTSVSLPATGSTTTLLDACTVTTGWTGTINGFAATPATTGSAVTLSATLARGASNVMTLQKTFAATTTATKYLVVDWKPPTGVEASQLTAVGDGVALPLLAEAASPTSGYTRSWFYVAASSLAVTQITWTGKYPGAITSTFSAVFSVDNVAVSDVIPISGTGRQQQRSLAVPGSARTQGSLAIESATAALGDTLVYVYPGGSSTTGYSPPLRQFRVSGNTVTADAAQVSGSTEPLTGSVVLFDVPIGLFPAGSYLLMGRMATSGGGTPTISYTSTTTVGGVALSVQTNGTAALTTTTAYQTFALGRMQLPTVDMDPGSAAVTKMRMQVFSSATCTYDDFWLFNTTVGRLIRVDCGTGAGTVGGTSRRLFIEPATVTTPRPTVRIGHSADRSDSHYPDLTFPSWQPPEFKPPQVNVLVVTPNATDATITLSGYARHHTNATS